MDGSSSPSYFQSFGDYSYYFTLLRVFRNSFSWWFFIRYCVTAVFSNLQECFQYFGQPQQSCRLDGLLFSGPQVLVSILWWLYRAQQLRLVSPSLLYFFSSVARSLFFAFFQFKLLQAEREYPQFGRFSFLILSQGMVIWLRLDNSFISKKSQRN